MPLKNKIKGSVAAKQLIKFSKTRNFDEIFMHFAKKLLILAKLPGISHFKLLNFRKIQNKFQETLHKL